MFLFLKSIISDYPSSLWLFDFSPLYKLIPHSFQENWHDHKKLWRPPPIVQGWMMPWNSFQKNTMQLKLLIVFNTDWSFFWSDLTFKGFRFTKEIFSLKKLK